MTDEEGAAYLRRYPDVGSEVGWNNVNGAKDHWGKKGQKEGRDKSVEGNLSLEEIKVYMDRYPDVKSEFGKLPIGEMLKAVNDQFKERGQRENRNGEMAERITKQQA